MTTKVKYNRELLEQVCERDKCIIDFDKIEKYNRDVRIEFVCNCGNNDVKNFRLIYENAGAFCKKCTKDKRIHTMKENCLKQYGVEYHFQIPCVKEKIKNTMLGKYGVETALQSDIIKQKSKNTMLEKYGVENPLQSIQIKERIKQTCLDKYGVENPNQNKEVRNKTKKTCLEKYGVEHNSQSQQIKQKKLNTCMEKYGVENVFKLEETKEKSKKTCIDKYGLPFSNQVPQIKEKSKQTCIHKYGTENPFQSNIIKTKIKQTCLEKYGVENPSQNSKISEKQSKSPYKLREYIFPSGNTIQVQGYEPYLLDILVKEGYLFEDIITKRTEVPEIWYNKNDKTRRYYCDIYIPKTNTIYEVKSTWTYKKDIEDIPLKNQACIDAGYNFELYVFDSKGFRQVLD